MAQTALLGFAALLASALEGAAIGVEEEVSPDGDGSSGAAAQGFGGEIDDFFAALMYAAEPDAGADQIAMLIATDGEWIPGQPSGGEEDGVTGPLELSGALAASPGVSDPAQYIRPVVVEHAFGSSGAQLPPAIAPAASAKSSPEYGDNGGNGGSGEDGDDGGDDDQGSGDSGGEDTGDEGDGGDAGGDTDLPEPPWTVTVTEDGETSTYRLVPDSGEAFAIGPDGTEFPLPGSLASQLIGLVTETGRLAFDASELDEGLVLDTLIGSVAPHAGDSAGGSAGYQVFVHDGDATNAFWFDGENGSGYIDDGADGIPDAPLDPAFSQLLLDLVESTGRTEFDAAELDGGLSLDTGTASEIQGAEQDWFHVLVTDGPATEIFWFDRTGGPGYTDPEADGVPNDAMDPMFSMLLLDLVEETGRTQFEIGELFGEPDGGLFIDLGISDGSSGDFMLA